MSEPDRQLDNEAYTRMRWHAFAESLERLCMVHGFEMAWLITLPFVRAEFKQKPL